LEQLPSADFLQRLYSTALEPALWVSVMEEFADMIGGTSGWLPNLSLKDGSGGDTGIIARFDPAMPRQYSDHFAQRNPIHNVSDPDEFLKHWDLRILTDEDVIPKSDLIRTEYYNDFLRPRDVHSVLIMRLSVRDVTISTLNITRPERRGPFTRSSLDAAQRLQSHFVAAFNLGKKFAAVRQSSDGFAEALESSPHGLIFLDNSGCVSHVNRAAEGMFADGLGLAVIDRRLTAVRPDIARRLEELTKAASCLEREKRTGGTMTLPSPKHRIPLSVTVAPIMSDQCSPFDEGRAVIVCVSDLEKNSSIPEQSVRASFNLTESELRIAMALFAGDSLREIAVRFGIRLSTVRVHVAHIFAKTGVSRQSELVLLLSRTVGIHLKH
jgi:DNA-binding CsgD family transcriptional regulator/PAS domain-containing protein